MTVSLLILAARALVLDPDLLSTAPVPAVREPPGSDGRESVVSMACGAAAVVGDEAGGTALEVEVTPFSLNFVPSE